MDAGRPMAFGERLWAEVEHEYAECSPQDRARAKSLLTRVYTFAELAALPHGRGKAPASDGGSDDPR